jgi:phosphatidylinositol-4,5-bisphosphate 3-kinase
MHVPSVSVRFGLILEAYLKGNIKYLDGLLKQVNHLQRLASICKTIKEKAKVN